jgi:hypothetical protein
MQAWLSTLVLLLLPPWTLALAQEGEGAAAAPAETVSLFVVAVFGVLFIGMIVGFFVYLWWLERKRKVSGE